MAWDFSTEPEFEAKLDWMRGFVREEIMPLETLYEVWRTPEGRERFTRIVAPLKEQVKAQGLWAAHLPPEMGGGGFGQVKLGLMHEILGACMYAPGIFGNQAPDSGNAELIAVGGTEEQKRKWMEPLLAGELRSCFSMTEPGAGADPTLLDHPGRARRRRVGDQRPQVVLVERQHLRLPDRDVPDQPRRRGVPALLDDHRADAHARGEHPP